jgi:2-polyprenyl-3-methyl-5-hydroxy-6-metoxy-1,4-benzoquinol methylase
MHETNEASIYFDANWKRYQSTIAGNSLFHKEMGETLSRFLDQHTTHAFTLVDVGCGDSSTIAPVLANKNIKKYIGIDAAPTVLNMADQQMSAIACEKTFICDDMSTAIANLPEPVDIIFTSYAVHHLTHERKIAFIQDCQNKLNASGYLVMVDGVLNVNQTREQWLDALEVRFKTTQTMTPDELKFRMEHPRTSDFPEAITTFQAIANQQHWQHFDVLLNKGIFAFMIFKK